MKDLLGTIGTGLVSFVIVYILACVIGAVFVGTTSFAVFVALAYAAIDMVMYSPEREA